MKTPLFLYDENCGLCRYWTRYWKQLTKDRIEYRAFENSVPSSSQFIETDGQIYFGAHGIVRLLSYAPGKKWMLWSYQHILPFAWLSEFAYKRISSCRACAAKFTHLLWGENPTPSRFFFIRPFVLFLIGFLFLILFILFGFHVLRLVAERTHVR